MKTKIQFTNENAKQLYNGKLEYATKGSAGFDLRACYFYLAQSLRINQKKELFDMFNKGINVIKDDKIKEAISSLSDANCDEDFVKNVEAFINEEEEAILLDPQGIIKIGTGIKIQPPKGYATFIYPRSGFSTKNEVILLNSVGVIDNDYIGEIIVCLKNISDKPVEITLGDRIAQAVIKPILQAEFEYVEQLEATERGSGGFGSTGR